MNPFMKTAKKCNDVLLSVETAIMAVITAFLVLCIFIEVVCRYFFFISVPWAEELTRYLFIWLTYIGSAYAVYYGQHTEIDVLQQIFDKSKDTIKTAGTRYIKFAAIISTFIFQVWFGVLFWDYMIKIFNSSQTSPTMHIPMGLIYLPVFIGTVMGALHCVYMFIVEIGGGSDRVRKMESSDESLDEQ